MPVNSSALVGLIRASLLIGIIYVTQSVICVICTTKKLQQYSQDKRKAATNDVPFDSDKEEISVLTTSLTFGICGIITSSLLIWGILKRKHLYFVPWLFIAFFLIIITGIYQLAIVYKFICHILEPDNYPNININIEAVKIIIFTFCLVLQMVVYKIIRKLRKELIFEHQTRVFETSSATYIIQGL
ncbi:uncharacterized protein [Musca autumnalis]|uniref:uncharacterized protein n=1 Tax=Musca autumnalis TaxID=221902 RepID=UPI003CF7E0C9